MGLFDELDVASAPEIKYEVLTGKFPASISEVVDGLSSKGNRGLSVKFRLDDETKNIEPQKWFQIPVSMDRSTWDQTTILYYESGDPKPEKYNTEYKENMKMVSDLRKFLADIGIPPSEMNSVNPESDLLGLEVVLTMGPQKSNPTFTEVKMIAPRRTSGATAPRPNPTPGIPAQGTKPAPAQPAAAKAENPWGA